MKNSISVKHIVVVFLIAHTAVILLLVFLVLRAIIPSIHPLLIVAGIALGTAISLYTADRIIHHVNAIVANGAKGLTKYAKELQDKSKALDDYALALKVCALNMSKNHQELIKRSCMLNEYGHRMNELMEEMDISLEQIEYSS